MDKRIFLYFLSLFFLYHTTGKISFLFPLPAILPHPLGSHLVSLIRQCLEVSSCCCAHPALPFCIDGDCEKYAGTCGAIVLQCGMVLLLVWMVTGM